jgi:endoglucanase
VAFTTQEEVGTRGAGVAAQTIRPDAAFVLEGTTCADMPPADSDPDTPSTSPVTKLGDGPALTIADRSVIVDRRLLDYLRQTADAADIPYQYKRAMKGGTDAGSISLSGSGVPSAVISVPCRYIHGPAAMCHLGDVEQTVALLRAALAGFSADVLAW